jgi:cellulose synthase/poly-beta-1,6-N-acetylglucosamine synthase-like glycosyltransferase/Leucine-rich repeat (LRR) protein
MASDRRIGGWRGGFAVCIVALVAGPGAGAGPPDPTGSAVLLDFEDDAQFTRLRLGAYTRVEPAAEAFEGKRAARIVYSAVPDGVRDYPAVVVENEALRVRDLTAFEAISLWVMNPGPDDVELSLSIWDARGHRGFPVPSTVTIMPGRWQQVVARLALHGLDATRIGSIHFYQKANRRPVTLLIDDVRLLSPYAGRFAAKIQAARDDLARARGAAEALGARAQVESTIAALSRRLDRLGGPAGPANTPSQTTQRMADLARVAADAQDLAAAIAVRTGGRDVRLTGPLVEPGWLSNSDKVRRITALRLFDTALGDDAFAHLAAARDLETLIVSGRRITGAGLAGLSAANLRRLALPQTGARDDALAHLREFRQLRDLELNETDVTSGVLRHIERLDQLRSLRLSGTGVADTGFDRVAALTGLESLALDRTQISGEGLRHVAGLTRLKVLDLRDTRIDDAGLAHLGKLVRLESLALANTTVSGAGFRDLGSLDNLVTLNLNATRVGDSALRHLGKLPKLKRLELSGTRITDGSLQKVAAAKLEYLDLYGTNVSDAGLAHLHNQRGLQALYLGGTQASDAGVGHLQRLTNLEQLDLSGTRITDAALAHLRQMTKLTTLRLGKTAVAGAGLAHLTALSSLRTLDLSGTVVSDEALAAVARLEGLRTLDLSGTRVTSAGMRHLGAARQLVELHLEATAVGDEGLDLLAALSNLQQLTLNETAVTNAGLKHLRRMEKVRSLSLNQTAVTDDGLSQLGDQYTTLELAGTRVTDQGVEHLQRNDQLVQLRLAATGITDKALDLIRAMPGLRQLDLAETGVTDAGLEHLARLPELQQLNLNGTAVSDGGIGAILKLPGLQRLSLENARVTAAGSSYLRHRAPQLDLTLVFPWAWGDRWSYYPLTDGPAEPPPSPVAPPPRLGDVAGLRSLHVTDALLSPELLQSLKDLPGLEHLSLHGSSVTDEMLADLLGLSRVARLDLSDTQITDQGLIHLRDMQGLRELSLKGTRVTGGGFSHLAGLNRLRALDLRDTPVDDRGLAHLEGLTALRKLELGGTRITDDGIEHLLQLPALQYLDLFGTALTDAALARLGRLSSLRYLYLSNTAITDAGVEHLRGLTGLEELGLDGTDLTDRGMAVVRSLSNLRRLRVGRTRVTDAGLVHVAGLPNLSRLEVDHLPLTDAGLAALRSLSKLQMLDLAATRVTDRALTVVAGLPALDEVDVRDTSVTPEAVAQFRRDHPGVAVATGITPSGYSAWSVGVTVAYGLVVAAICFYGAHRYWLVWQFVRDEGARTPPEPKGCFTELPAVTVQLPMFNERHVAERVIEAACALDYAHDRLRIQVLDDSTDESADIARRCCDRMADLGHRVTYVHRPARHGFKGGALAAGLETASGEFVAVFDADFVPPADFLQQTIHHFTDPGVGMVQAEWAHLNRGESLLTEIQAVFLDGHFVIEQTTRGRNGRWFNFNGTAGVWRRRCIEDAGGWRHDTLTEDTDLSYRAQLKGWRFVYLPAVRCGAELPSTMTAFLGQQHRWTKGLMQTARKLLPQILRSRAPWAVKLEAWYHLTAPVMYLVMFVLTAIALPALFLATPLTHRATLALTLGVGTLGLGTCAAMAFYAVSQRAQGFGLGRTLVKLPVLMALGVGMCAVNGRAVLEGLLGFRGPFVRTPKFGGRADCDPDPSVARRRRRIPPGVVELVIAGVLYTCLALTLVRPYTLIGAPFLLLFALGYSGVGLLCLLERYGRRGTRPQPAARRLAFATLGVGTLAITVLAGVTATTLAFTLPADVWAGNGTPEPVSLGVDLTTAEWRIAGRGQAASGAGGAVKRVTADRGSLVLGIQLDETTDQGEIVLDLGGPLRPLGDSLRAGRRLSFDLEYPTRFTGEFQAFVRDGQGRSEYGSMEFVEGHDGRRAATVSLIPDVRVPPMGYQDEGFDPTRGIRQIGFKVSAQSDRVRGAGYRPFRGTVRVAKVRVADVDRAAHPEPEVWPPDEHRQRPLSPVTAAEFRAASGVDRPWPLGYGFSGPVTAAHVDELDRTYAAIARLGCRFTRVYVGDYRTGLVFDGQGRVAGVEPDFLAYLDRLAEVANRHGVTVMFSLTDNTLADGRGLEGVEWIRAGKPSESFVTNVVVPFVQRLKGRRVIWDVFNEPENVTALPLREVQGYVDRVLAAGRRADPDARFTVVSRSREDVIYWQGRGLDLYSHNVFTERSLAEALAAPRVLDAPIMVAEMAPELASAKNMNALRDAGYFGVGIWGWGTGDKYDWDVGDLGRIAGPLVRTDAGRATDTDRGNGQR